MRRIDWDLLVVVYSLPDLWQHYYWSSLSVAPNPAGRARIRLWNVIQVLPPLLTLAGMLLVVVVLGRGVDAAIGVWTIAYVLTAMFALVHNRPFRICAAIKR